ncbi:MAG: DUF4304 domain-containing protein [Ruminococcaceae bacterium]|nr:DUF4304 domain-containing protein [Oscillospiraceae bacterium]
MTNNEKMKSYFKKLVIAPLFEEGFTGKYPHFRRVQKDCIELISVQTNKWGGSFTIEVSAVFPNSNNKNYAQWEGLTVNQLTVWNTNERYRLKGMYNGWFYYRNLYAKRTLLFGKNYYDVPEKHAFDFIPPRGYKLVQKFDDNTAIEICNEVNKQFFKAFKWLNRFEKRNK